VAAADRGRTTKALLSSPRPALAGRRRRPWRVG
jgi:hypothetical protein